jgi:predicted phage terminase large subunit-like protein
MATSEQAKESARRRKANQRAREKGLPEPYGQSVAEEEQEKSQKLAEHDLNLTWAMEQDTAECFYKSECRSMLELLAIYEGNAATIISDEDEKVIDPKTGKKKNNLPIPVAQKIQIRAISLGDTLIDPIDKDHRKTYEVDRVVSFRDWLDLRDKARKDLFWLGRLLGKGLFHATHKMICDAFVQKNFDGMYFPDCTFDDVHEMIGEQHRFDENGNETRTLMLFAPRSGYKSTIDGLDTAQWMLNCPDIRVMIMTSVKSLSSQLMGEIKSYFYLPPRGKASAFQVLFPEYILTGVDGRSEQPIICPAQLFDSKEPHVWVTSLDSSFVGQRCDIRKLDDIVDDKNSADEELREKLKEKIKSTNALVEPWGFTDIIGTRYFTTDWYGWRMGVIPEEEDSSSTEPFKYLCLSCWAIKPEFMVLYTQLLEKKNGIFEVTENMVDLWFPYKLDWKALRTKMKEYKERGFKNQYLNIATDPIEVTDLITHFDRETLRRQTYGASAAPTTGELLVVVDWAYTDNKGSDYCVLAAVRRHIREDGTEELIVIDIDYDKWRATDLADHFVRFLRQHKPSRTFIEACNGIDLLMAVVQAYARKYDCLEVLNSIHKVPTGNTANEKTNRIKTLEVLIADNRLHFVSGPWIDELYKQFERFTGETKKGRKDDIPDAISQASRTLPQEMFVRARLTPEEESQKAQDEERAERRRLTRAQHDVMFGGRYGGTIHHPGPPSRQAPTWRERLTGQDKRPTPQPEPEPEKPRDPRMVIFGNKGPWRL